MTPNQGKERECNEEAPLAVALEATMSSQPIPSRMDPAPHQTSPGTAPASNAGLTWTSIVLSVLALVAVPAYLVRTLLGDNIQWAHPGVGDIAFFAALFAFVPAIPTLLMSTIALVLALRVGGRHRDAGRPRLAFLLSLAGLTVGALSILASVIAFVVMVALITPNS